MSVRLSPSVSGSLSRLDGIFGDYVVDPLAKVLFFDVFFWDNHTPGEARVPLVVGWLVLGAAFFTLRMSFVNLRAFGHAFAILLGRYDDPSHPGEVSHFKALSSALSATVGLGNIAGVAVAIGIGGPGASFWMAVAGFLGMSSKFTECTLAQMYRDIDDQGKVLGGPMRYLDKGLAELGRPRLGKGLAVSFALLCIVASLGAGNMFQANQSYAQVARVLPFFADKPWLYGLLLAALVAVVIVGGIRRIGTVASYIVPFMCALYLLASGYILFVRIDAVPDALATIFRSAFSWQAGLGGWVGVMVTGFRRAAFSNEAGIGSAPIAHSAAATDEPIREGIVALLEPFIDTIVVCSATALVVVVTGAYLEPNDGIVMTSIAFESVLPWFPGILALAVLLFAFSSIISWSYYGERCWVHLFGEKTSIAYKLGFVVFVFLGAILTLAKIVDFSDLTLLAMAFPNILGMLMLSRKVRDALDGYLEKSKRA